MAYHSSMISNVVLATNVYSSNLGSLEVLYGYIFSPHSPQPNISSHPSRREASYLSLIPFQEQGKEQKWIANNSCVDSRNLRCIANSYIVLNFLRRTVIELSLTYLNLNT